MCLSDSTIGAASALRLELATMRRDVQRWWSVIGGNVRQSGASPNTRGWWNMENLYSPFFFQSPAWHPHTPTFLYFFSHICFWNFFDLINKKETICVMVCAWSYSFQRTIIGWLRWSLQWWPSCLLFSISLYHQATLPDLYQTSVGIHPYTIAITYHHCYHYYH